MVCKSAFLSDVLFSCLLSAVWQSVLPINRAQKTRKYPQLLLVFRFGGSRKPSKKHRKSICHKGSPRTLKQRPRGSQNGVQMVPKPPKNEIRILTRKATSKKTSKYQIRTLFAMFAAYPGPPKNRLFGHFLETKTSPGAPPEGTCKTACKKVTPFSQK